jgi:hypothetical protein
MHVDQAELQRSRRRFLTHSLQGAGTVALANLLAADGLLAVEPPSSDSPSSPLRDENPLAPRRPYFAPKAKNCIYIYLEGGPSQMDLYDHKPILNQLDGQPLPDSLLEKVQFAFLQKETARLMGTPRTFQKHGQCGMELSDLLPHLATCVDDIALIRSMTTDQFNHVPAQLLMNCGSAIAGRPSIGSWLSYGLGSDSQNLPAFITMVTVGRGVPGGSASWSSGFLPSIYSGVLFGNGSNPVQNLSNPDGVTREMQLSGIRAVNDLNRLRMEEVGDRELASRISSYELAFRMQSAAPELIDLSDETQATLDLYGLDREEPPITSNLGGTGLFGTFARNCLQARRMIERGVRVVNVIHASWDHHSNLDKQLAHNTLMADQPIAALLKDLKQRGLLDETLVVCGSEFGRTPLGENRAGSSKVTGRDHHPASFSMWVAGGGVKGGQTIGQSDDVGWGVAEDPVHVHDLHATILHLFGLDHTRLTYRFQGRDFRLTDVHGNVVHALLS